MKSIVLSLMVLLIAIGLAGPMVGNTFASFSDIETSQGNYLDTADLDLKVNGKDDEDVEAFFNIPDGEICTIYPSSPSPIPLWNEGSVEGTLHLHIKNLVGPNSLSQNLDVEIWYDGSWISESIYNLACQQIELGHMPADGMITEVFMELHAIAGAPGESLTFDIAFELFGGCGYSDIETSQGNYFLIGGLSGTRGFWSQWDKHKTYDATQINGWLQNSDAASYWLVADEDSDGNIDTDDMDRIFANGVGGRSTKENRFLAHYLAQRLDQESGRQSPATTHDVTDYDSSNYLGLTNPTAASGAEIVAAIESKHPDYTNPAQPWPTDAEYIVMKDVCVVLNELRA